MEIKQEIIDREKRFQQGKALREKCPRNRHAEWTPSLRKLDPIKLLEDSNIDRVPGLVAVRYQRMSESPFKFFRGSSIIQARDLVSSPMSGILVQLCGDCHLLNFGGFATPERSLVFDINDFDETFAGPWEWDIKRLVVSFILAARESGFSKNIAEDAVRAAVSSYRKKMSEFAEQSLLDRWYAKITIEDLMKFFKNDQDAIQRLQKAEKKAYTRTPETLFPKITTVERRDLKIKDEPPLIYHPRKTKGSLFDGKYVGHYKKSLQEDRRQLLEQYQLVDSAMKVVGIGSVGTRCFVSLFLDEGDEPLFLQTKEARRSVLESPEGTSCYDHQGYRIVHGQRLMQAASDIFLGWFRSDTGHDYYVRQLHDMKISVQVETFKPRTLIDYATMCGRALARAHSKAGDASMISGYIGTKEKFDDALVQYAILYADQVERDFKSFKTAIQSGRLRTKPSKGDTLEFEI